MRFSFSYLLAILAVFLPYSATFGQVSVDRIGFATVLEQEAVYETEINLHNAGDEAVPFNVRIRKMNREEERRFGPRRDEQGETLSEHELEYPYTAGLAWDAEEEIMYGSHVTEARIVGYRWNGEEITEVTVDFVAEGIQANMLVALAYYEGVLHTFYWSQALIYRYDVEGNQLESIETQWDDELTYGLGLAIDPENAHLYMTAFHNAGAHCDMKIYDINDDYNQIGYIDGIENMGEVRDADVRNRLNWVPEHEDGHLWVYERNQAEVQDGAIGPDTPPYHAWQLDIIPGEEGIWEYEVIDHFEVESDAWSNGISHDGENLWIGNRNSNLVRIIDDGLSEAKWIEIEPRSGEVPADQEITLEVFIEPVELEDGVYEQLVRIGFDDPAGTVIEMSVVMSLETPTANVSGTVIDAATDEPLEGVRGDLDYYLISRFTDEEGGYSIENLPMGEFVMTFTHPDYMPASVEVVIEEGGDIVADAEMLHGEFNPDREFIRQSLAPDDDIHVLFDVSNDGNAPVEYSSERRLIGDADTDPWELRASVPAGIITEDSRIQGAVFIDDLFYVPGANNREPLIYVLNRDQELVDQYDQLGEGRYGYKDIATDGEIIWGSGERNIYGFNTDGEEIVSFDSGISPCNNLAWDSDREILWASGTTTDILGFDREGNQVAEISRHEYRVYGLAYWPDDPDGYQLYIFHKINDVGDLMVAKIDIENDQAMDVANLQHDIGGVAQGCFITNEYDIYSWVFMGVANNGGEDRIDIWQLDVRKDWFLLDPIEGVIEANESQEFDLHLNATDLPVADFEGEIVFSHNGLGSQAIIPVIMNVEAGRMQSERTLQLAFGWNMVSVNLQPNEEDVTVLTRPLVDAEVLEMMKDGAGHFYNPQFNFNNIPGWSVEQGYLMKLTEDAELTLEGETVLADDPIQLQDGWQMVSYYPRRPIDAILALSGIVDQLELAKDAAGHFYNPQFRFSNIGDMREGQGYLMKVSEDVELVYNLEDERNAYSPIERLGDSRLGVVVPTGENMSLLLLGEGYSGCEVGVYADGLLVGSGHFTGDVCGVAVWGDDPTTEEIDGALPGQLLELIVNNDSGDVGAEYNTLQGESTYTKDGFWAVQLEDSQAPSQFGISEIYPNPFNAMLNLRFEMSHSAQITIGVYDISGRLVEQLVSDEWTAGHHKLRWDASLISAGVYLVLMEAPGFSAVRKALLVK